MGVMKMFSSSSFDNDKSNKSVSIFSRYGRSTSSFEISKKVKNLKPKSLPNPKPDNYTIMRSEVIKSCIVVEIKYHDCINYEGRKILVYENCTLDDLKNQKLIDPHFCDNGKYLSPIARFEPTETGWGNACKLSNIL